MGQINWKSIKGVLPDWEEDSGSKLIIEPVVIKKWAHDEVKRLITSEQYIEKMALITVNDYIGEIPNPDSFVSIIQAAYGDVKQKECTREEVVRWTKTDYKSDCKIHVELDCPKCGERDCEHSVEFARVNINEIDLAQRPDWTHSHTVGYYKFNQIGQGKCTSGYNPYFILMRPSLNNFFGIKYHIKNCVNLNADSVVEYKMEMPYIRLNIKKAKVLMVYFGLNTDAQGYVMVPDIPQVWDCIRLRISERIAFRQYEKFKTMETRIFHKDVQKDYKDAFFIAKAALNMPDIGVFKHIMKNHFKKIIPNYYNEENFGAETADTYRPYI